MGHRKSIWKNSGKRAGFSKSTGSYEYRGAKKLYGNDRYFVLTALKSGKTKAYESPEAAQRDGWYIAVKGE